MHEQLQISTSPGEMLCPGFFMLGLCAVVNGFGLAAAGGFAGGAGVFAGMPAGCWGRPEAFTLIIWGRRPRAGLGMGSSRDGTCTFG